MSKDALLPRKVASKHRHLMALAIGVLTLGARQAANAGTSRISMGSGGAQANALAAAPSISGDGRFVAFISAASNLVASDNNGAMDVFVRDLSGNTTERVSLPNGGGEANGSSGGLPSIAPGGRFVAFESQATNLEPAFPDTNGTTDIFVRDRTNGTTQRLKTAGNAEGNGQSNAPSIVVDANGNFLVAFVSSASNFVAGDTNGKRDVFIANRFGISSRASVSSSGAEANGDSSLPILSADARVVAFHSNATNLVAGDGNGVFDVFVRDLSSNTTERVSVVDTTANTSANGNSSAPAISADGRYVAFLSTASNLVSPGTNGLFQAFVRDRTSLKTQLVSVDSSGVQANGDTFAVAISGDGRFITLYSAATNLVPNDTNGQTDIFVHDRQTGLTERVNVSDARVQAMSGTGPFSSRSFSQAVSADGRLAVFESDAGNLVSGDTNGVSDVFVETPTCGNGGALERFEECDDGNGSNADDCLNTCKWSDCGSHGRTCNDGDGCSVDACNGDFGGCTINGGTYGSGTWDFTGLNHCYGQATISAGNHITLSAMCDAYFNGFTASGTVMPDFKYDANGQLVADPTSDALSLTSDPVALTSDAVALFQCPGATVSLMFKATVDKNHTDSSGTLVATCTGSGGTLGPVSFTGRPDVNMNKTADADEAMPPTFATDGNACPDESPSNPCTHDVCGHGGCTHPPGNAGVPCHTGSGEVCDAPKTCTGMSSTCPVDVKPSSFVCHAGSGDACDPGKTCSGNPGTPCPAPTVTPAGVTCYAGSGDMCDPSKACSGNAGAACPSRTTQSSAVTCYTGSADVCDPSRKCSGAPGVACPARATQPSGTPCYPGSGDMCDPSKACSGNAGVPCPAPTPQGPTVICRPSVDAVCDPPEHCPASALQPCTADVHTARGAPCPDPSSNPCTIDTCGAAGTCQHTTPPEDIACVPAGSREAVIGGPNNLCAGGGAQVVGGNCVLSTPRVCANDVTKVCNGSSDCPNNAACGATGVDLSIPLNGIAQPTARSINIMTLPPSAPCSGGFALGTGSGPGSARLASCFDFGGRPKVCANDNTRICNASTDCVNNAVCDDEPFPPSSGVTMTFHWAPATAGTGCPVYGFKTCTGGTTPGLACGGDPDCGTGSCVGTAPQEGQLHIFDENYVVATPDCGTGYAANQKCPAVSEAYTCSDNFCSDGRCDPNANTWTVNNVAHFSPHAIGTSCSDGVLGDPFVVKATSLNRPPGMQAITVRGDFVRQSTAPFNPMTQGVEVTVWATYGVLRREFLPPGAYDRSTRRGWMLASTGAKWVYRSAVPGTFTRATLLDRSAVASSGSMRFTARASRLSLSVSTPDRLDAQLYLPGDEDCVSSKVATCTSLPGRVICK